MERSPEHLLQATKVTMLPTRIRRNTPVAAPLIVGVRDLLVLAIFFVWVVLSTKVVPVFVRFTSLVVSLRVTEERNK